MKPQCSSVQEDKAQVWLPWRLEFVMPGCRPEREGYHRSKVEKSGKAPQREWLLKNSFP